MQKWSKLKNAKPNKTQNQGFKCDDCEYICLSKPSLIRHMATTHASAAKGNIMRLDRKRKLPEKKEKCDICGRMLINVKGLDLHKKRMHNVKENNPCKQIIRTDSVKSATSPPPKKHEKDSNPKENTKKLKTPSKKLGETAPPQDNEMDTEKAPTRPENHMEVEEDLRLAKLHIVTLKRENEHLRHINKTQI